MLSACDQSGSDLQDQKWIARQPFTAFYRAFSFWLAALSTAVLRMVERGESGPMRLLALPIFVGANLGIAIPIVGTVRLTVQGRLPPPHQRRFLTNNDGIYSGTRNPIRADK